MMVPKSDAAHKKRKIQNIWGINVSTTSKQEQSTKKKNYPLSLRSGVNIACKRNS
jgi:hypothetical protein